MEISNIKYFNDDYIEKGNFEKGKPLIDYIGKSDEGGFYSHPLVNNIQGVNWEYRNHKGDLMEVEIFEEAKNLFAYPSPNMKYLVVIFDRESAYYPHPNNLVVFCPNGKIRYIVGLPELISEYAIVNKNNPMGVDKEGYFRGIGWYEKNGETIMKVDIDFAWENTETREFNPETGKFGALIGISGRH